jgi:hypothetical protein
MLKVLTFWLNKDWQFKFSCNVKKFFLSDQWFCLGRIPEENGQIKAPAGQSRCVIYTLPQKWNIFKFLSSGTSSKPTMLAKFCWIWERKIFYLHISSAHICLDCMLPTPDWTLLESDWTAVVSYRRFPASDWTVILFCWTFLSDHWSALTLALATLLFLLVEVRNGGGAGL